MCLNVFLRQISKSADPILVRTAARALILSMVTRAHALTGSPDPLVDQVCICFGEKTSVHLSRQTALFLFKDKGPYKIVCTDIHVHLNLGYYLIVLIEETEGEYGNVSP